MPRGGARPGAGRKPKHYADFRRRMEIAFEAEVKESDVAEATRKWLAMWKRGEVQAAFLWDRILGKVADKTQSEHTGVIRVEVEYVHTPETPGPTPGPGDDQA